MCEGEVHPFFSKANFLKDMQDNQMLILSGVGDAWVEDLGEVVHPSTSSLPVVLPIHVKSTIILSFLFSQAFGPHPCSVFNNSVLTTHSIFRSRISDCILSQFAECWKIPLPLSVSWS